MQLDNSEINIVEIEQKTGLNYGNEFIEAFKCPQCSLIFIGLPDCHIAFYNSNNLKKKITYNRPEKLNCPCCNFTFPDTFMWATTKYKFEISLSEIAKSEWKWLLRKNADLKE